MGHERIGFLPKTKQWKAIVDQLTNYGIQCVLCHIFTSEKLYHDTIRLLSNELPISGCQLDLKHGYNR